MGAWLESLLPWGYSVIQWVQQMEHPVLTFFFQGLTLLGSKYAYLLILPLVFWSIDARIGRRLGFVFFVGAAVNLLLKATFGIVRPETHLIASLAHEQTPSFPSGHAQGTLILWGYIAYAWKTSSVLRWTAPILVLLIGFSRVYLGVHFPQDVLAGWLFGSILLCMFIYLEQPCSVWFKRSSLPVQIIAALFPAVCLMSLLWVPGLLSSNAHALSAKRTFISVCGALAGFSIGMLFEQKWVFFSADGTWRERVLRYGVGVVPVGCIFVGLKWILPDGDLPRFMRYASTAMAVVWWIPWLFQKMKLQSTEEDASIA